MSDLPFDKIDIGEQAYSADEFLQLPLSDRVKAILFGRIAFFYQGKPVSAHVALKALRLLGGDR